jgi:FAD/FMN-containing dehydrogenase
MLVKAKIEELAKTFRGKLIQPNDPDYDAARTVYNAMIDKHPRLIARCADVADVLAAVNFGREHDLDTAIRGGGHSGPGLGLVNDGLVIDLSCMKGIRVDPKAKTVRVEAGCRWGDVDHATHAFGLATVSGIISNTGVSGLTLGGGHGYLTRKYGLTIDNLLAADVALADGQLVCEQGGESDLFWALRGGGNFGVGFAQVSAVSGGYGRCRPMFWPIEQLKQTLNWYREWLPQAPEDVYAFYLTAEVPAAEPFPETIRGKKVCGLVWCCTGPKEQAETAIRSARDVAEPLFEHIGPMPYPVLQSLFDGLYPSGLQWYWKGDFFRALTDEAIDEHLRFSETPTGLSLMHLYPIDGAVRRVGKDETAWGYRDATWSMVIAGVDPSPANNERMTKWARDYWHALHPYSAGASYINFMMEEGRDRIRATYGDNYERVRKVKAMYNPDNFFHVNQNIEPAK